MENNVFVLTLQVEPQLARSHENGRSAAQRPGRPAAVVAQFEPERDAHERTVERAEHGSGEVLPEPEHLSKSRVGGEAANQSATIGR